MESSTIDNQKYLVPSWEEMGTLCFDLAQKIIDDNGKFDRLIALVKGGLTWSRTLLDYLDIKELSTFQIRFYTDIKKTTTRPIIVQSLPVAVENENVLLFDDVVDSGETLKVASEYLSLCGAKKVVSACLFQKTWAKYKSDFKAYETDAWVVFPPELRETITLLSTKWKKSKVSAKEIEERLIQLRLPKNQVNYFLELLK